MGQYQLWILEGRSITTGAPARRNNAGMDPLSASSSPPRWPARHWAQVSARDFALAQGNGLAATTVAVLPVGAVEQHGPHLPLTVYTTLVDGIVAAALPQLPAEVPVLVLPTQSIGLSLEHESYAGTLGLSPATLLALWTEIGACVARAGVKKLLLFNAHGGNVSSMDIVARQLRMQCGLLVYHSSWFNLPLQGADAAFSAHEHRFGVHGGEVETAMMLHLAPEAVRMAHARNFASSSEQRAQHYPILGNGKSAKLGWAMQDYNPQGAAGNAAAADAARGKALVDAAAASLAALLQEIHQLPADTVGAAPLPLG
jgi:creatinine amidohydrolase